MKNIFDISFKLSLAENSFDRYDDDESTPNSSIAVPHLDKTGDCYSPIKIIDYYPPSLREIIEFYYCHNGFTNVEAEILTTEYVNRVEIFVDEARATE